MSASVQGDAGTSSAGLKTTVLPNASAGAIFHAGIASGKFHGVIAATTPSGSRVTSQSIPGRTDAIFSPPTRSASPAKNLKMNPARAASPTASASGFPCSRASSLPSSSLRARISLPARSSTSNRSCGVVSDHFANAFRAAAMARSTSAAVPRADSPTTSPRFDGLMSVAFSADSITWPSIKFGNACMLPPELLQSRPRDACLIAEHIDDGRKILAAMAQPAGVLERLTRDSGDRHGHLLGLGRLHDQRKILVCEIYR